MYFGGRGTYVFLAISWLLGHFVIDSPPAIFAVEALQHRDQA
jgi:hypothetical protein